MNVVVLPGKTMILQFMHLYSIYSQQNVQQNPNNWQLIHLFIFINEKLTDGFISSSSTSQIVTILKFGIDNPRVLNKRGKKT